MRRTQNYGFVVNSLITSYANARDSNLVEGNVGYYGLLTDIIELDYYGRWKVVLFRCDWDDVNTARGIKKDQFGFTIVNFSHLIHTGQQLMDEPYVFSSQVKQVFYSKDPTDESWYVVLRNTPRDLFDMGKMRRRRLRDLSIVQNTPNSEEANSEQQIVVGSSNVPETLDEREEFQTKNGGTRRVRGHTLLRDLYDLDPVEHVKVSRDTHGYPVGSEARLLAGYLGILAQNANMLPINYDSWHHMPDSNKNQALANMKEVKSGQKVRRLQLFEITHRKKDGSPITFEAEEIMEKLKEKKAEYEAIALTDSSVNLENIDNKIIIEVLGPKRYGRIAQMQATTVEQIAEVQRKYEELQQQIRAEAAERKATAAAREASTAAREAEATAMAVEQSKKYDDLQL
ncbi:hypothetical protein PVK06_041326 [Gossypium arboreum]|uniref:DUF4216 domain-containing protein n=1 Tax=Gossypium arboreum TaxID=29729 RepID=A0ABR0N7Y2_GOSAR|nr:hypothetical protein PVK06_041326 [Gossypium arboreum]